MKRGLQGTYTTITTVGERARAFVPRDLPPDPPVSFTSELQVAYELASNALGRLDGVTELLPDPWLFNYTYVRREAVLSSMIEGTQSSLSDLIMFEQEGEAGALLDDVIEVSNYVAALELGMRRLAEGMPICLRLIKELHGVLLNHGRGADKRPGEFRTSQNWIGGSRPGNAQFVPPPAEQVLEHMGKLELFLNDLPEGTPPLLKAALAHVQFETIHPFLDGNGRLGRLLIALVLCRAGLLREPLLYLSLWLKTHRSLYYSLLTEVRETGNWEAWLDFFLEGVAVTANGAVQTARKINEMFIRDRERVASLGRAASTSLRVHQALRERPVRSIASISTDTGLGDVTASNAVRRLTDLGIVRELTGRKRGRVFAYGDYLDMMNEGAEPFER